LSYAISFRTQYRTSALSICQAGAEESAPVVSGGERRRPPEHDLCKQIAYDAGLIRDHDAQGVTAGNTSVDIANRAMMIWYRHYGKALMQAD